MKVSPLVLRPQMGLLQVPLTSEYGGLVELKLARNTVCHKHNTNYTVTEPGPPQPEDGK
jgi:hypothetical protein